MVKSDIIDCEKGEHMKYYYFENETYNLYTIETPKFKSGHMEVVFKTKATKENITYLSVLMGVLFENTKEYPTRKLLSRKLCDLYNVTLNGSTSRVGDTLITNATIDFLDPKYTDNTTLEETIKLLFDVILNPNADSVEFDEATFERIKRTIANEIESVKEDPKQSSILGAFKELGEDDVRSFSAIGDMNILNEITPRKLYKFYLDFLNTSPRDVYLIGNLDMKMMNKMIRKYAKFKTIVSLDTNIYLPNIFVKKSKASSVDSNLTQANFVQIYSFVNMTDRERDYVVPLFNMLWGSGSLESKLYKSLRSENSLCYNVNTYYQKYDRVIVLHTAIDEDKATLTTKLILKALASIKKGVVEEEELENVKNQLETSLYLSLDSPDRLIDLYVFKNLVGLSDIETRIDEIRKVTLDEIIAVSKKMRLVLSYRMRGE